MEREQTLEIERRIFEFILAYKQANDGNSPSIHEIMAEIGTSSTSYVAYYLNRLAKRGKIFFSDGRSRRIRVVGGSWSYRQEAGA